MWEWMSDMMRSGMLRFHQDVSITGASMKITYDLSDGTTMERDYQLVHAEQELPEGVISFGPSWNALLFSPPEEDGEDWGPPYRFYATIEEPGPA